MGEARHRVALIGAGMAVAPWLDALSALGCRVVTVATRRPERHSLVADRFPEVEQCWPPEDALARDVSLCVNLSPASNHLDGIRMAARAGLPLILEKPLETTLDRGMEGRAIAIESGIPLAVCFQYRYQEGARALRGLLNSGALGQPRAATLDLMWWRSQEYYDQPGRGTYARDGGGVLLTQAVHALDLLVWYLGLPSSVRARLDHRAFHDVEVEDVATALLEYGDGGFASVFATTGAMSAEEMKLRILGDEATAVLTGNRLEVFDREGPVASPQAAAAEEAISTTDPMSFSPRWHQAFLEETLDAFERAVSPPIGSEDALISLSLIDAMERSAAGGSDVQPWTPWLDKGPGSQ